MLVKQKIKNRRKKLEKYQDRHFKIIKLAISQIFATIPLVTTEYDLRSFYNLLGLLRAILYMAFLKFSGLGLTIILVLSTVMVSPGEAQVTVDRTSKSRITRSTSRSGDETINIQDGHFSHGNLLHSFDQFSLTRNQAANFVMNPHQGVQTIFARVTGGDVSRINGTISSNRAVNLVFMNPSGIEFQANARLRFGGSFLATTGSSINFDNGQVFSAIAPQDLNLLKVKTPIGIQFGAQSQPIHNFTSRGLTLDPNQSLSFLGGDIRFEQGRIRVRNGKITLAAIDVNQEVAIEQLGQDHRFNFFPVSSFRNLQLDQASRVNTRSNTPSDTPGRITIWGQDLSLDQQSLLRTDRGEKITIQLKGIFSGNDRSVITSQINDVITPTVFEQSGDISITAKELILREGSQLRASVVGEGKAGTILLSITDRILITDISELSRLSSAVLSDGFRGGSGGDIIVKSPRIELYDGGLIRSQVFREAQGGKIQIKTQELILDGGSQISSTAINPTLSGIAGPIEIEADKRVFLQGSRVVPEGQRRFTQISAESMGTGRAGEIQITTPTLEIVEGAKINTQTNGEAGGISLTIGDRLVISGISYDEPSSISSDAFESGTAGIITIHAPSILSSTNKES